jgi:hypothetical protein
LSCFFGGHADRRAFRFTPADWGKTPFGSIARMKYSYFAGSVAVDNAASLQVGNVVSKAPTDRSALCPSGYGGACLRE